MPNNRTIGAASEDQYLDGATIHRPIFTAKGAALTPQLTAITHTAPVTPDYALQDLLHAHGYGFATRDEGNTVLSVIANLQARVLELEAQMQALALID